MSANEGNERANAYKDDVGNFIFYFKYRSQKLCIDATSSTCLAKFVNDSPSCYSNCKMTLKVDGTEPHLCLIAIKNIAKNEEIRYDYGESIHRLSWRKDEKYMKPFNLDQLPCDNSEGNISETVCKQNETAESILKTVFKSKEGFKKNREEIKPAAPATLQKGKSQGLTKGSSQKQLLLNDKAEELQEPFMKIEDQSMLYRPQIYQNFYIPDINYSDKNKAVFLYPPMKEKERSNDDSSNKTNFCEICNQHYKDLDNHRMTSKHVNFVTNPGNYVIIDENYNKHKVYF